MLKRLRDTEEGFTLIELLVVVIIIGILAAIAIPTFLNQRQRGWQAQLTSDTRNYALELEAAGTTTGGTYPADAARPAFRSSNPATISVAASGYVVSGTGNAFCLITQDTRLAAGEQTMVYASHAGGMQPYPATTTCPAF